MNLSKIHFLQRKRREYRRKYMPKRDIRVEKAITVLQFIACWGIFFGLVLVTMMF